MPKKNVLTKKKIKRKKNVKTLEKTFPLNLMLNSIIHEISSPMQTISLQAELIEALLEDSQIDTKVITEAAKSISSTTMRIKNIIDSIKKLSHNSDQIQFQVFTLSEILSTILNVVNLELRNKQIAFSQSHQDELVKIKCGFTEFTQVLLNLFNNSIYALNQKSEKWIKISSKILPKYLEIHFTDSGNGIPMSVQKKLFATYFTTKPIGIGTGLGLNISRQMMLSQNGSLEYDNTNKKNTNFIIKIPLA